MKDSILINGSWQSARRVMPIHDAYKGTVIAQVACATQEHAELAIESASKGFEKSKNLSSAQRYEILFATAKLLEQNQAEFADSIVCETGKTITAASKEVMRAVNTLMLCAEEAKRLNGETIPFDSYAGNENRIGYYDYQPLGTIVCITPFNDPLNLVAHKLGPAIATGNAVILKPAEQAPLTALMLVRALLKSGLPDCIVSVLTGYGAEFGDYLVSQPEVAMVSFTGSSVVGEKIAKAAGAKKLLMELGANSPVIVLEDADIDLAVESSVSGSFLASGHNCIGVQRVFIHEAVYDVFREKFVEQTKMLKVGDPHLIDTDVGPMVDDNQVSRVQTMVKQSIELGAKVLCGGEYKDKVYLPTVFDNPPLTAPVVAEEVFGPVVSLFSYNNLDSALELANLPDYGIHGAVFTSNIDRAFSVASALDVAGVMINDSTDFRLDAMPFGGSGRGSLGREGVYFAMREMCNTKVYCFNLCRSDI